MKLFPVLLVGCVINPCFAFDDVSLTLTGEVSAKCGFEAQSAELQFSESGLVNTVLVINCNTPMKVSIHSQNGGLRHQQSNVINNYRMSLSIVNTALKKSYLAEQLHNKQVFSVSDILFERVMDVQFQLTEPLIYAGEYKDILRIEMTPTIASGGVW